MVSCLPADPNAPAPALADALLESDAAYFEAAACRTALPGAVMAWMEGLAALPAAGVVHRVEPGLGGSNPRAWLDMAEQAVRSTGRHTARIYLVRPHRELESLLRSRGYEARTEIGFLHTGSIAPERRELPSVSFRAVVDRDDWLAKDAVHAACDTAADGHPSQATEWALLERRKVAAGFMRPFLVVAEGTVCGVVSVSEQGSLRRLKNLVLHPAWRHRGIGSAVIRLLAGESYAMGRAVGVFAVAGGTGERIYRHGGFEVVNQQTEWIGRARL